MITLKYLFVKFLFLIQPSALLNCKIGKHSKIGHRSNLINVNIGKYSYLGNFNSMCDVQIGSYCSIASFCSIGGGDHCINQFSTSPIFFEGKNIFKKNFSTLKRNLSKKVIIGNDVWIGEKVFIKPGISIGDGAIIGAHAVVTKNVGPYEIVCGCPARKIKDRFDKLTIERLIKSQWWTFDERKLMVVLKDNPNVDDFLKRIEKYE